MTTGKQVIANQRNAQLSTGPRTPAGKDASKWNALRHGLRAETVLLPDEAPEDYEAFRQALVDELAPGGELEAVLVERIVSVAWRLRRAARVEAGLFVRNHYDRLARKARAKARSYKHDELDELLDGMGQTVTDPDAHDQALRDAAEAEDLRDADTHATAAAFQRDSQRDSSDTFSKLARYETSIERSLYKALHELQRFQAARAGGKVPAPVVVDVNVDAGHPVVGL